MTTQKLVIVGCGGFGRELSAFVDDINRVDDRWEIIGYVDDFPSDQNLSRLEALGHVLLGGSDWFDEAPEDVAYVVGIASPQVRRKLDEQLGDRPVATLIHPDTTIAPDVRVGPGSVLCPGVRITTNVVLGRHVHLNQNVTVGHDTTLGNWVTVNPLASISGDVTVEPEVLFGTNSTILQGLTAGAGSTIGAGACAVRDVPVGTVVKGIPAK
ncbi:acetyltransferase [Propionibacteriaceae bacterium Y1685]|uniref:acetyltransferase n=1 Tax=Microlunatus sp. Y1700 TaxID=3418487 RepID=UPI003B79969B